MEQDGVSGKEKGKGKGKASMKPIIDWSSEEEKVRPRRAPRGRRIIPSTPSTLPAPAKPTEVLDCIELPRRVKPTIRKNIVEVFDLTEELADLQISPSKPAQPSEASTSHSLSPLEALLQASSQPEAFDFDSFLTSDHLLDLLPSRAQPSFSKIGEASYSEVFSVQRGKQELVIKVIPLLPVCQREGTDEVPDCSTPEEVLREVEITKTLAALPSTGFVDIKG
jgi:serine/threonine-protein kinase haspin